MIPSRSVVRCHFGFNLQSDTSLVPQPGELVTNSSSAQTQTVPKI